MSFLYTSRLKIVATEFDWALVADITAARKPARMIPRSPHSGASVFRANGNVKSAFASGMPAIFIS